MNTPTSPPCDHDFRLRGGGWSPYNYKVCKCGLSYGMFKRLEKGLTKYKAFSIEAEHPMYTSTGQNEAIATRKQGEGSSKVIAHFFGPSALVDARFFITMKERNGE